MSTQHKYNPTVERLWVLDTVTDSSEHSSMVRQAREGLTPETQSFAADDEKRG
jgi:hypothetical protein